MPACPPDSRVLATKVGRVLEPVEPGTLEKDEFDNPAPFKPVFDFSYDGTMRSFDESLKRLQVDRIDILHIHDPDDHFDEAIKGAYPALDHAAQGREHQGGWRRDEPGGNACPLCARGQL